MGVRSIITHEPHDIVDVTANASRIALYEDLRTLGDAAFGRRRKGGTLGCLALGPPIRLGATRLPVIS